mgnify:CR=1 FL=1
MSIFSADSESRNCSPKNIDIIFGAKIKMVKPIIIEEIETNFVESTIIFL